MIDSATIASQTPSQAPQPNNVLKCPVLSGPTDPPEQTSVSIDSHETCEQTPSCPDQTSATPEPPAMPQQDQMPQSDLQELAVHASHQEATAEPSCETAAVNEEVGSEV